MSLCRRKLRAGEVVEEGDMVEGLLDNTSPRRAFPIAADEFHRN